MGNLVLGLLAIILGGVILVTLIQLVAMFVIWKKRKSIAKGSFNAMNSMLETMSEAMDELQDVEVKMTSTGAEFVDETELDLD